MESEFVRDATDVASARRRVIGLAVSMGYSQSQAGRVAIVVTELAQNLLRHGGGGEILAGADRLCAGGIEILALDRGPGMADIVACMGDGYSTSGTSGNGLGAVKRLAHEMLIHSDPRSGTAVLVRMNREAGAGGKTVRVADAGAIRGSGVVHSGGSGVARTTAIIRTSRLGQTDRGETPTIITPCNCTACLFLADACDDRSYAPAVGKARRRLQRMHQASAGADLRLLLSFVPASRREVTTWIGPRTRGVNDGSAGEICAFLIEAGRPHRMLALRGAASEIALSRRPGDRPVLAMDSDLATMWSPLDHPALFELDPTLIAGVLYRDYARGWANTTVLVWKR